MADLIFLALGGGAFVAFAGLAAAMKRMWRWSFPSSGGPGPSWSPPTWSRRSCAPSGS